VTGCAARSPYNSTLPTLENYSAFIVSRSLYEDARGCHELTRYANGRTKDETQPESLCTDAALWLKAVASVPKSPAAGQ